MYFKPFIALLLVVTSTASFSSCPKHTDNTFFCAQYVKNYDADTITFNIPNIHPLLGRKINIRVLGIDTPEIKSKNKCEKFKAKNAKMAVQKIMKNAKRIDLTKLKRGKYFRIVADVIVDGKSLTALLLKRGYGYQYDGGTKKKINWCKSLK